MEGLSGSRLPAVVAISDSSQVFEARRQALNLAAGQNWDETSAGKLAIVATEIGTNLVKHAQHGEVLIGECQAGGRRGVELLALDRGPGIGRMDECLRDGYSGAGTSGSGLGAISRLSDEFGIYSQVGKGTTVVARLYPAKNLAGSSVSSAETGGEGLRLGAVQVPVRGERECGDNWAWRSSNERSVIMLADGLGHGPEAAKASLVAVETVKSAGSLAPAALLERIHQALRHTRGAAVAIAAIDSNAGELSFAGIGNISAVLLKPTAAQHLVSHNGTAGHNARRIQEFRYAWGSDTALVMHSDGITTRWRPETYPGLARRHPALLAATLLRDESRGRDDACILVAHNANR